MKNGMKIYVVALIAALAGLLLGLDVGVISGALKFISTHYHITSDKFVQEQIVSMVTVGAVLGVLASGRVSRVFGRKKAILLSSIIFTIGAAGSSLSFGTGALIVFRLVLGVGVGIASFTAPLYLSEMAPERQRGSLISMYQLLITIGILGAFLSDWAIKHWITNDALNWRIMLGIVVVPSVCMFFGVLFLPESPRWLVLNNREKQARAVLRDLRSSDGEVDLEIKDIKNAMLQDDAGAGFTLLHNPNFRRALLLGMGLQICQQLTGINVMMYYSPAIFKDAHLSNPMLGTVLIGAVNVLATFIAIAFVDRWGRKPILYVGQAVMAVSMAVVGLMFYRGADSGIGQAFMVAGLVLFVVGFAMSSGPVIWILCSEIFPLKGRELGVTVSTMTNWIGNTLIGASFLSIKHVLGDACTFWLFAALNASFIIFFFKFCPETKGVSLEQIEKNLMGGKPLRQIGG